MAIKTARFKIKGMNQDLAVSSFSPEFAYENYNLRITANETNTLLSLTNEKGNVQLQPEKPDNYIQGRALGYAVISDKIVLFTHNDNVNDTTPDRIYRIDQVLQYQYRGIMLYEGNLNFDMTRPIETLAWYENEDIQKVYWVDGLNQPRVINVMKSTSFYNDCSFDFCRELELSEDVSVQQGTSGRFHSGVIQYCFTYFDRYGQETNIAWESQLFYIAPKNRGGSPDEIVDKSFTIVIDNVDKQFEYLRLYAILRTTKDGEISIRKVADISTKEIDSNSPYSFTDTGNLGESIDSTYLFYVGGSNIIAGCIQSKDNTLFLGDIKLNNKHISDEIKEELAGTSVVYTSKTGANYNDNIINGYYLYNNQLGNQAGSYGVTTFKMRETYRFGIQLQYKDGQWSEVYFLDDVMNDCLLQTGISPSGVDAYIKAVASFSDYISDILLEEGFKKVRPVVVYPSYSDRDVICQGVLCPTVFNINDRFLGRAYAYSSWFFRPMSFQGMNINSQVDKYRESQFIHKGSWMEFRHNQPVCGKHDVGGNNIGYDFCGEIQGEPGIDPLFYDQSNVAEIVDSVYGNSFNVDQQIITMHSPDIEFDDSLNDITDDSIKLRIVGVVPIHASSGDIELEVSNSPQQYCYIPVPANVGDELQPIYDTKSPEGFYKEKIGVTLIGKDAWRSLVNGPYWQDRIYGIDYKIDSHVASGYEIHEFSDVGLYKIGYVVYPWQQSGSLANDLTGEHSKLEKKIISNLKFSLNTTFFQYPQSFSQLGTNKFSIGIFNQDTPMLQLESPTNKNKKISYLGNCNKLISYSSGRNIKFTGISKMKNYDTSTNTFINATLDTGQDANVGLMQSQATMFNSLGLSNNGSAGLYSIFNDIDVYNCSKEVFPRFKETPVQIKYKSSKHGVIVIPNTGRDTSTQMQYILPNINGLNAQNGYFGSGYRLCFDVLNTDEQGQYQPNVIKGIAQDQVSTGLYNISSNQYGILWLGELYRPSVVNKFGGTSEQAKMNNTWYVAGPTVTLSSNTKFDTEWLQGDTFYQRYDHLKTYSYSEDDENQVIEIISFMCESRVNIDGRYDKLRGLEDNTIIAQELFNKVNNVYSQQGTAFIQSYIPSEYISQYHFPNTVIWSDMKINGEFIDKWTQILTTNSLDLDGSKGRLRSLKEYGGNLISFQDKAIAEILFNPNIAIATTDGSPIELASSGKVEGKRYKFNNIGCKNKWSICETPYGLFFNDDLNKNLMVYTGDSPLNVSDKFGMSTWAKNNMNNTIWDYENFDNMTVQYDRKNKDVLYITSDSCLAYSNIIGGFTSFYSYENIPYFINIGDYTLTVRSGNAQTGETTELWMQNSGNYYGQFFGERKPFYTMFIVNDNPTVDKVFNTLEYRADYFNVDGTYNEGKTFSRIVTWNEYQSNGWPSGTLIDSNVQKKFRIWRLEIPRDMNNTLDRMRNPWQYIKIQQDAAWGGKVEIHDFAVHYTE